MQRAAAAPEPILEPHEAYPGALRRRIDSLASALFGRGLRVILGSALLAVLAFWLDARGIVTWPQVRDQAGEIAATIRNAVTAADPGLVKELKWNIPFDWTRLHAPVELEGLPAGPWQGIQGSNLALAALVLLGSALSGHRLTGFLALVAAAIALFGAKAGMTLPAISDRFALDAAAQARALAVAILVLGFILPRRRAAP